MCMGSSYLLKSVKSKWSFPAHPVLPTVGNHLPAPCMLHPCFLNPLLHPSPFLPGVEGQGEGRKGRLGGGQDEQVGQQAEGQKE